jgi:hypothetical protein
VSIGVVIERREEFEIPAVAAEEDFAQIDEAVDGLLQRRKFPSDGTVLMFNLAVVFEKG